MSTKKKPVPPPDDLRQHIDYDPMAGTFTWRVSRGGHVRVGGPARSLMQTGYGIISFKNRRYMSSHIAWWLVHGEWPSAPIDHANLNRSDDRIANLRIATYSQNIANGPMRKNNTSGFRGVCFDRRRGRWLAYLHPNRRFKYVGVFRTAEEAARARDTAAIKFFGEFAQLNFPLEPIAEPAHGE